MEEVRKAERNVPKGYRFQRKKKPVSALGPVKQGTEELNTREGRPRRRWKFAKKGWLRPGSLRKGGGGTVKSDRPGMTCEW